MKRPYGHGLTIRPDIIIHKPFDEARHDSRKDRNIAVIELKRDASQEGAVGDFESLVKIMEVLAYRCRRCRSTHFGCRRNASHSGGMSQMPDGCCANSAPSE